MNSELMKLLKNLNWLRLNDSEIPESVQQSLKKKMNDLNVIIETSMVAVNLDIKKVNRYK